MKTLRKYGVGTCGPRGFYGTIGKYDKSLILSMNAVTGSVFSQALQITMYIVHFTCILIADYYRQGHINTYTPLLYSLGV